MEYRKFYKYDKEKKIRLFGEKFVENNKKYCKIIYKGEKELCTHFYINDIELKKNMFEIKLKGITKVKDMSYLFAQCKCLIELPDISKWDTSKVEKMCSLFEGCISLTSLPGIFRWKTDKVTNMNCIFYRCESLKKLPDISNWETKNVKTIHSIFCLCKSLKYLPDISKWNTENFINMIKKKK